MALYPNTQRYRKSRWSLDGKLRWKDKSRETRDYLRKLRRKSVLPRRHQQGARREEEQRQTSAIWRWMNSKLRRYLKGNWHS